MATFTLKKKVSMIAAGAAVFLATGMLGAGQAQAVVIDFEDLGAGISPEDQINPPSGYPISSGGFTFTPGPNDASGLNDLHVGMPSFWPSNGTTVLFSHDDVILTKADRGLFSLQRFDFSGWVGNQEVSFSVTGIRSDSSTVTQLFNPDGLADGPGGVADFQTFDFNSSWTDLVSATWTHTGSGTAQGLFGLDNIVAEPVPEPNSILGMLIFGATGSVSLLKRKQQQKAKAKV